ncbi:2TM domain-containing protein [Lutibacter citreus]|uniref:2TM domain-containing protein n=1 Tax=Lutibacter citreus TaxID=2138210 RepID=UPI000DBE22BD|nr:2TM domain-containing protein [Lutibacter citreus]
MENNNLENQKFIRAQKKVKAIKGFYIHLIVYLSVNAFIILSRVLSGDGLSALYDWSSYGTLIFWGIGIFFHAFGVFGMDFILGKAWEDKKIKELMDKDKKQYWE